MNMLLAKLIGGAVGLAIVTFCLFMIYDMGTGFARFERVSRRREARKERRLQNQSS